MRILRNISLALSCLIASGAQAHEFWIEPLDYQINVGAPAQATLHVGEAFKSGPSAYIPGRTARFDLVINGTSQPVTSRMGDNPALNQTVTTEGLLVVVHETTDSSLTYANLAKFQKFVDHKAMAGVMQAHADRGLPDAGFKERYRRFAKSLIAVGGGAGADAPVGLRTEIVALDNPYTDAGPLRVQVLLEGAPRAGAQVELFDKAPDGTVTITLHTAAADGIATLPVTSGHSYLADAVTMLPLDPVAQGDPVWLSLWAALTFAVP